MTTYADEDYEHHLKGLKCEHCKKPMRSNKKHLNYYREGWTPQYHKKCYKIASYLEQFYE